MSSKPIDLTVYRNEHKEVCIFCAKEAHETPLVCPRIESVDIDPDTGGVTGIHFWADYDMEDLEWDDPNGAA